MKKIPLVIVLITVSVIMTVFSCKKNDSTTTTTIPSTPANEAALQTTLSQNANDQTTIQNDEDFIESDVQKAVLAANNYSGINPTNNIDFNTLPNAVIDMSSLKSSKLVKILYKSDATINGITKSGTISIQLINGTKWRDQGAKIVETLDSVKITYFGITRIYQSTRYITNVGGGLSYLVNSSFPFTYTIHSYGTVTFQDNTVASYWIARRNTLKNTSDTLTIPTIFNSNGDTTVNGDNCTMGGSSRTKKTFRVKDAQTYAASIVCGYQKPYLGIRTFIAGDSVNITFGVNSNGVQSAQGAATPCDSLYGYKIEWTKLNGTLGSKVISY